MADDYYIGLRVGSGKARAESNTKLKYALPLSLQRIAFLSPEGVDHGFRRRPAVLSIQLYCEFMIFYEQVWTTADRTSREF